MPAYQLITVAFKLIPRWTYRDRKGGCGNKMVPCFRTTSELTQSLAILNAASGSKMMSGRFVNTILEINKTFGPACWCSHYIEAKFTQVSHYQTPYRA